MGAADDLQRLEGQQPEDGLVLGAGDPIRLVREIVATHHFHARHDLQHIVGKFVRRWLQLPDELAGDPRVVDLRGASKKPPGCRCATS